MKGRGVAKLSALAYQHIADHLSSWYFMIWPDAYQHCGMYVRAYQFPAEARDRRPEDGWYAYGASAAIRECTWERAS